MKQLKYENFSLTVGDPVVVLQGGSYEKLGWGPYQFPSLALTRDGNILYTCNGPESRDDIDGYEGEALPFGRVSQDCGETWRPLTEADKPAGVRLKNGHGYFPPGPKNAFAADWLSKYTPDAPGGNGVPDKYYAEKIKEFPMTPAAFDYDPDTGLTSEFPLTVRWPYLAMMACPRPDGTRLVYPLDTLMGIMGHVTPARDGALYFSTYQQGFSAETGAPARKYTVYVLSSRDNGRTWEYLSEILTAEEYAGDPGPEGFCEPFIEQMPDGSFIMLMRTGSGCPSYIVRSTDECKTWSKPEIFDRVGVFPRLLRLGCGVTLASYGRPGVFLRATEDASGLKWLPPVDLDVPQASDGSCCYTSLLALDDSTALIAYSYFKYPDKDGFLRKTLLVRKISVRR